MTTTVTVKPTGHDCLVTIMGDYRSPGGLTSYQHEQEVMLAPFKEGKPTGEPESRDFTITTTQSINVVDLEPDDPRVLEKKGLPLPKGLDNGAAAGSMNKA